MSALASGFYLAITYSRPKKETHLEDVFSPYRLIENDNEFDVEAVPYEDTFLSDNRFVQDFTEPYYKNTQLLQLVERDGKLHC